MADLDRVEGTLLGTAVGDALGLATEGMSARSIRRRFGMVDRFRLLGSIGFVSDDTEQSALVAQSLARHGDNVDACVRDFRRSLLGWFCRLPWGVGLATVRASIRIALRLSPTGVMSAGNGAAMRAAIIGVVYHNQRDLRDRMGRALAEVTHRDPRAVAGALYVAELAAQCAARPHSASPRDCVDAALSAVQEPDLAHALNRAHDLAGRGVGIHEAAEKCGTSGFILHTAPLATFAFIRFGDDPTRALSEIIGAGGDTDSNAAILGAWLGALHGKAALPAALVDKIHDGPFGPTHLRALAASLCDRSTLGPGRAPSYSWIAALVRNLALYPVIIAHGLRRLLPL